jgi:hypothetical protein
MPDTSRQNCKECIIVSANEWAQDEHPIVFGVLCVILVLLPDEEPTSSLPCNEENVSPLEA